MTGTRQFWEWTWNVSCSKSELACLSAKGNCCKFDTDSFLRVLPVTTNIVNNLKPNLVWNSCRKLGVWSCQRLLVGPVVQSSDVHIICKLCSLCPSLTPSPNQTIIEEVQTWRRNQKIVMVRIQEHVCGTIFSDNTTFTWIQSVPMLTFPFSVEVLFSMPSWFWCQNLKVSVLAPCLWW